MAANLTINADHLTPGVTGKTLALNSLTGVNTSTIDVTGADGYGLSVGTLNEDGSLALDPTSANVAIATLTGSWWNYSSLDLGGTATGNTIGSIDLGGGGQTLFSVNVTGGCWTLGSADFGAAAPVSVSGGTLVVNGMLAGNATVSVGPGGTLAGPGTIGGSVSVTSGGAIAAGPLGGGGVLDTGNLTLGSGATFDALLDSDACSQVDVSGTVNLSGATLNLSGNRTAQPGDQIVLIDNQGSGAVIGTFNALPEGAIVALNGALYTISYQGGDGNDVVLTYTDSAVWANAAGHSRLERPRQLGGRRSPLGRRAGGVPQRGRGRHAEPDRRRRRQRDHHRQQPGRLLDHGNGQPNPDDRQRRDLRERSGGTGGDAVTIGPDLVLAADQTFTAANDGGVTTLTLLGGISGGHNLATAGGGNVNFAGSVNIGGGGLTIDGSGVAALGGAANAYSGGTVVAGGTLRLAGPTGANQLPVTTVLQIARGAVVDLGGVTQQVASIADYLGGGGTVTDSGGNVTFTLAPAGGTATFSGVIADGAGLIALVLDGAPGCTQVMAGANAYTGGTTIIAGTLQLGDGATQSGSLLGNIVDNAALVFASPAAENVTGVISGSGGVTEIGGGPLTLSAQNAFTGPMVIGGGTVLLGVNNALPGTGVVQIGAANLGSGVLDLNGYNQAVACLMTDPASSALNLNADLVTNTSGTAAKLTVSNTSDYAFGGTLAGNLSVNKYGSGTWTLGGENSNSGDVAVYDGTLNVTGGLSCKVYTVPGAGSPQLAGNTDPYYWVVTTSMILGDQTYGYDLEPDLHVLPQYDTTQGGSPVFVTGDWTEAVRRR